MEVYNIEISSLICSENMIGTSVMKELTIIAKKGPKYAFETAKYKEK